MKANRKPFQKKAPTGRNGWYLAFLLVCILFLLYPMVLLVLGEQPLIDPLELPRPFLASSCMFSLLCGFTFPYIGSFELICITVCSTPWLLCILSGVLAVRKHKAWQVLACILLVLDIPFNWVDISFLFPAIFLNIALIVILFLAVRKQKKLREAVPACVPGNTPSLVESAPEAPVDVTTDDS